MAPFSMLTKTPSGIYGGFDGLERVWGGGVEGAPARLFQTADRLKLRVAVDEATGQGVGHT